MKYKRQICDREIDDLVGMAHVKAEEYLLDLIRRDHPKWKKDEATCDRCIEYYHRLVEKTEIWRGVSIPHQRAQAVLPQAPAIRRIPDLFHRATVSEPMGILMHETSRPPGP